MNYNDDSVGEKAVDRCTCTAVRMTSRHLSQVYDHALAPSGLRTSQFALLRALSLAGPVRVQDIAERVNLDRTTAGRNLRPLERDGLVEITVDVKDRRARVLVVTDLGRAKLEQAEPLWRSAQDQLEQRFGWEQTWQFHAFLRMFLKLPTPR